ncbi:MAG: preprotein translocase subunit SecE [Phycisphaerae bacterium]|jgi:preprotein translocase SecE subunit|nr:preprotein translocase subunit SecE [Phycisphaerae bacterium]
MASGIYKAGQGYYTRMGTTVGASLLGLLGLRWLWDYAKNVQIGSINQTYVAFGICCLVGGILAALIYVYVFRKPGSSDFLIATEGEMKKVNWSTRREIFGSTGVVISVMAFSTAFLWMIDQAFVFVFQWIGVLEGG